MAKKEIKNLTVYEAGATAYLAVVLAASIVLTPLPFSVAAAVLLILQGFVFLRPVRASLRLSLSLATFALLPLILEPLLGAVLAGAAVSPVLVIISRGMKDCAIDFKQFSGKPGRHLTSTMRVVLTTFAFALIVALFLSKVSLIIASLLLAADLAVLSGYAISKIPAAPLEYHTIRQRVLVRNSLTVSANLKSAAAIPMRISLVPTLGWISLDTNNTHLSAHQEAIVSLLMTPPLAAPSKVLINACTVDPWGIISVNQAIEPVELHVIPKAVYAEWLAKRYLEQTVPGYFPSMATPPLREVRPSRRAVDYYGSRPYQPGDRIKDVDWKETFKLQELVVKEFSGGQAQPAIIAVDLTARDAEDADALAYDLITSALTMAKQGVPTALTAYNAGEVVETTGITHPREALKNAMVLSGRIVIAPSPEKVIGPIDLLRLNRNIALLEKSEGNNTRLERALKLESRSAQAGARDIPVTRALKRAVDKIQPPAAIIIVTSSTENEDALAVNIKTLKEKGYRFISPKAIGKIAAR